MPESKRIKGKALALKLGTPPVDHWQDITSYLLDNKDADSDVTTFADAAAGGAKQFFLKLSAIQSTTVTSFWRLVWEKSGTDVAFTLAPHGNATPTPDQPHYVGIVTVGPKPPLGGEAGATFKFDTEWNIVGTPTVLTT
ncbi:hypothetical protein [Plantibacter sp. YIM 135347]|uniref:hypothetical protein n=1 Tax=Plantibacter sp. YIM 135347 TaxID=3423919 RepID=UPI003D328448